LGKVAIVTGAGSGIGKAAAIKLAQEGAKIGALSCSRDEIQQTVAEVRQQGSDGIVIEADVSEPGDMERAYQALVNQFGRVDIIFANTGINGVWAPLKEKKNLLNFRRGKFR